MSTNEMPFSLPAIDGMGEVGRQPLYYGSHDYNEVCNYAHTVAPIWIIIFIHARLICISHVEPT